MTLKNRVEKLEATQTGGVVKWGVHNTLDNTWFLNGVQITREEWEELPEPKELVILQIGIDLTRL